MKIKYTPGENGLRGRSHRVEITAIEIVEAPYIEAPILKAVRIKFENGKSEWVDGSKLFSSTDMVQRALVKRVR